jgi:hypothetical protein
MPLRDHFHPPLSVDRPWEAFHSAWAAAIANQLNDSLLPVGYVALPLVSYGPAVEIDVAAMRERAAIRIEPADWTPSQPAQSLEVDWSQRDVFEVRVIHQVDGPRLAAAVELVSPANKDRPAARRTFAGKCAGYLRQGVGAVVVDVVTARHGNLHHELIELLELNETKELNSELYAVAYRTTASEIAGRLEVWAEGLSLGQSLPTLPLWLAEDLAVPLNLETSYEATCRSLRMT